MNLGRGQEAGLAATAPDLGREAPDWTLDALCQEFDPEVFYPDKGQSSREAKSICHKCLCMVECLEDALLSEGGNTTNLFGVRGGLTGRERGRLVRAQAERAAS